VAQLLTQEVLALGPRGAELHYQLLDALAARLQDASLAPNSAWAAIAFIAARVGWAASENDPDSILHLEDDFNQLFIITTEPA
jgi:TorA maturation chaperone TorD